MKAFEGTDNEERREREKEGIINYMDALGDMPIIYAGDMNSMYPGDVANLGTTPVEMLIDSNNQYSSNIHTFIDVH